MARYIGPKTKIARRFKEAIYGPDKNFEKRGTPPGQHGNSRKRTKLTEYAIQLYEKQKAKYTYGVLERRFRNTFEEAARRKGATGENLIKLLEARLDNAVYRLGISPSRPGARQLVSHKHITVNGDVLNIPSYSCVPGDVISLKNKSAANKAITDNLRGKNAKFSWLDWSESETKGTFIAYPERESVPENIKEQLIVELYSK
jgi:small subunit ribosomal protein S4